MSGGSLEYLYTKEIEDIIERTDLLERARDYLIENNYEDVAKDVEEFIYMIKRFKIQAEVKLQSLVNIFHDIEWILSADGADLEKSISEYRGK